MKPTEKLIFYRKKLREAELARLKAEFPYQLDYRITVYKEEINKVLNEL